MYYYDRSKTAAARAPSSFLREAGNAWKTGVREEKADDGHEDHEAFNKSELEDALEQLQRAAKAVARGDKNSAGSLAAMTWSVCYFAGAVNG